jgi:hypothetical protein
MQPTLRFRLCATLVTLSVLALLIGLCIRAAAAGSLLEALQAMATDPWGLATLADLAAGLIGVAVWMCLVEARSWRLLLWVPSLFLVGNIATCIFLLARLRRATTLRAWFIERQ